MKIRWHNPFTARKKIDVLQAEIAQLRKDHSESMARVLHLELQLLAEKEKQQTRIDLPWYARGDFTLLEVKRKSGINVMAVGALCSMAYVAISAALDRCMNKPIVMPALPKHDYYIYLIYDKKSKQRREISERELMEMVRAAVS